MRVTIRLFARLRDLAGAAELSREVPDAATVDQIWSTLVAEFPSLAPHTSTVSGAINADYARMNSPVADGDEVAFLPPVSGGGDHEPSAGR
jgi:molybdopterin converting factor subunit 1